MLIANAALNWIVIMLLCYGMVNNNIYHYNYSGILRSCYLRTIIILEFINQIFGVDIGLYTFNIYYLVVLELDLNLNRIIMNNFVISCNISKNNKSFGTLLIIFIFESKDYDVKYCKTNQVNQINIDIHWVFQKYLVDPINYIHCNTIYILGMQLFAKIFKSIISIIFSIITWSCYHNLQIYYVKIIHIQDLLLNLI